MRAPSAVDGDQKPAELRNNHDYANSTFNEVIILLRRQASKRRIYYASCVLRVFRILLLVTMHLSVFSLPFFTYSPCAEFPLKVYFHFISL